jgi:hypothetical protein
MTLPMINVVCDEQYKKKRMSTMLNVVEFVQSTLAYYRADP